MIQLTQDSNNKGFLCEFFVDSAYPHFVFYNLAKNDIDIRLLTRANEVSDWVPLMTYTLSGRTDKQVYDLDKEYFACENDELDIMEYGLTETECTTFADVNKENCDPETAILDCSNAEYEIAFELLTDDSESDVLIQSRHDCYTVIDVDWEETQ